MPNAVAVITAKATSVRLPHKNVLPLAGRPAVVWSVEAAKAAGLRTLVATDSDVVRRAVDGAGCELYDHPQGVTHVDVIRHTLASANASGSGCVLLQPSSPFRAGNIVKRCLRAFEETGQTVLTSQVVHDVRISNGGVKDSQDHLVLWDGCVAVYPPGRIGAYDNAVLIRNLPCNSLQIDTEMDYELACATAEVLRPYQPVVPPQIAYVLEEFLRSSGAIGPRVAIVGRPGDTPDGWHVWHVNHCHGYTGGNCDGVAIVANRHHRETGISAATRECVAKAKAVLVRDNGELPWLREALPEINGKFLRVGAFTPADDRLTTGAILVDLLTALGCQVRMIGGFRPGAVLSSLQPFHWPAASREIGVLHMAGATPAS